MKHQVRLFLPLGSKLGAHQGPCLFHPSIHHPPVFEEPHGSTGARTAALVLLYIALILAIALFAIQSASAQGVPNTITYQGYVTNAAGKPLPDGSNAMQFRLYTAETGGSLLWDSGAMNVGVQKGVFAVVLGASPTPPLSSATLSAADVWLEVKVGTDPPMGRKKLTSAPFALRAADLDLPFSKTVSSPAFTPAFEVKNTGPGDAIRGESNNAAFAGVMGANSGTGFGLYGWSQSGTGVRGWNQATTNLGALGSPDAGVLGSSTAGYGVFGTSTSGSGVYGLSPGSRGVHGTSSTGTGVYGESGTGSAVYGVSTDGPGVYGKSTRGHAGYFDGFVSIPNQGNLGLGLEYANHRLYVLQNQGGLAGALKLDNPNSVVGFAGVGIKFSVGGDGANKLAINRTKGALMYTLADTWNRGDFHFLQDSGADDTQPDISNAVLTIKNNGRIGVGLTNPGTKLEVSDLMRVQGSSWPGSGEGLELGYSPTLNKGYVQAYDRTADTWGDLYLGNGNVGIGASAPAAKLDVGGDLRVTGAFKGNIGAAGGAPFPRPAYDSGWRQVDIDASITLTHNLGGNPDNYLVDLVSRQDGVNVLNAGIGGDSWGELDNGNPKYSRGLVWFLLNATSVQVSNWSHSWATEARLRIWVIK